VLARYRRWKQGQAEQEIERIEQRSERSNRIRRGKPRRSSPASRPPRSGIDPGPDFITKYGDPFDD
jgi:hypothetical protein